MTSVLHLGFYRATACTRLSLVYMHAVEALLFGIQHIVSVCPQPCRDGALPELCATPSTWRMADAQVPLALLAPLAAPSTHHQPAYGAPPPESLALLGQVLVQQRQALPQVRVYVYMGTCVCIHAYMGMCVCIHGYVWKS